MLEGVGNEIGCVELISGGFGAGEGAGGENGCLGSKLMVLDVWGMFWGALWCISAVIYSFEWWGVRELASVLGDVAVACGCLLCWLGVVLAFIGVLDIVDDDVGVSEGLCREKTGF
jgi:hypothetical protein